MDDFGELASTQQKKMFFALLNELGVDKEAGKEAVKKKLQLESFSNITKDQISEVIDKLQIKVDKRIQITLVEFFKTFPGSVWKDEGSNKSYAEWLAEKMTRYFIIRERVEN